LVPSALHFISNSATEGEKKLNRPGFFQGYNNGKLRK